MSPNLLNEIMPDVIAWAEVNRTNALAQGRKLTSDEQEFASKIGIYRPELIRVLVVKNIPSNGLERISKLFKYIEAVALGYGILVVEGCESPQLIRHELGHVLQVERVGDMQTFLNLYFQQVSHYGYDHAPFEVEAVNYESE